MHFFKILTFKGPKRHLKLRSLAFFGLFCAAFMPFKGILKAFQWFSHIIFSGQKLEQKIAEISFFEGLKVKILIATIKYKIKV